MKFHLKMTVSMLALLSLLFGIGGSMLIYASFMDALEREEAAAFSDYRMAWGTLQIVNQLDPYLDRDTITRTMEQLYKQNGASWANLRLSVSDQVLYEAGTVPASYFQTAGDFDNSEPGNCLFRIVDNQKGDHYLVLSGAVEANGEVLTLTTSHDITALYTARKAQQHTYFQVFLAMCFLCGVLSYTVSRILTAPLKDLSQAARAIASGNYISRVQIRSQDEIGALSEDFNAMAEQTEAYIAQLHQAVERQERFVGSFAHEMKTPMTSLIGYAELIRSGTLTKEEQTEAASYLYSEGKRLENLSRKLLELLVTKQQNLSLTAVSPGTLVEQLAQQLEPVYRSKGIQITYDCEDGLCLIEPDLVWSLLFNLADNAQKAMEDRGEIQFKLNMLEDGCLIRVLDSGRGIPPHALDHLTEAFYRADKARSRKQGGFGLGLALCQEIVALHHGRLLFRNRPEGGACVTVELRGGRP